MSWQQRAILLLGAICLGIAGGIYLNYRNSFSNVVVGDDQHLAVQIYKDTGGDPYSYNNAAAPVAKLNSSQTVRLRQGVYDAVVEDSAHEFADPVTKFQVTIGANSLAINPSFTSAKLDGLLPSVRAAALAALNAKYPQLPGLYTVTKDRLYQHGDWYGAVMTPVNPQGNDVLRVILQKQDSKWVVATDPPEISIGEPPHPDIPADVIDDLDQL